MHVLSLADSDDRVTINALRRQADAVGGDVFLSGDSGQHTYGQAWDVAGSYAGALGSLGVMRGDTVALFMESSPEMAMVTFGVTRAGAIWSPVSVEYRGEWLQELLQDVRSRVLFVDAHLLGSVTALKEFCFKHVVVNGDVPDDLARRLPGVTVHSLVELAGHRATSLTPDWHYGDTSAILWTSGTTGRSKGVEQPHNAWLANAANHNVLRGGIREGENFYGCVPMYNSSGWSTNIFPALISGVAAGIDKRFSVSEFWNRLDHYQASHTMMLGTMQVYLAQREPSEAERSNSLRTLMMNPPVPGLVELAKERWGVESVLSGYGQSEAMGAILWKDDWGLKTGACGIARDEDLVELKLLDENDREVGPDEVGEFCLRPREPFTTFNGYFHAPDKTAEAWRNLWYHTGDLGRKDADGDIFFVDRKRDSLRYKGRNLSSFEVEHVARSFPGVLDVAAVGIAANDSEYSSSLHEYELLMYVVANENVTIDPLELCQHINDNAPYFFVPRYVHQIDEFPMTPTSKVQKYKLRDKGLPEGAWDRTVEAADWVPAK